MTYPEAVADLLALTPELAPTKPGGERRRFDLDGMRLLCEVLGNPERRVPAVLIAGTNGKGSTAATLASILTAAGYRTGLYTSPHLERANERIQIARPVMPTEYSSVAQHAGDGPRRLRQISDADFARLYTLVDEACKHLAATQAVQVRPSFFERLTALAFLFFAEELEGVTARAEIMVLEVGLGGRLDATNVVDPVLCVITDIALDHQDYLGETIGEIAGEKAGILRRNGILVTLSQLAEANRAIGEAASALGVRGIDAARYLPRASRNGETRGEGLLQNQYCVLLHEGADAETILVDSPLAGEHQRRNLALAIATAVCLREAESEESNISSYNIPNAAIERGIRETHWPGRLEMMTPDLLVDVAHNPAGAWTLRAALSALDPGRPRTLIFSCVSDKPLSEMAGILFPLFDATSELDRKNDQLILVEIPSVRATPLARLLAEAERLGIPARPAETVKEALVLARRLTPTGGLIVATGSIYLVGEVRGLEARGAMEYAAR